MVLERLEGPVLDGRRVRWWRAGLRAAALLNIVLWFVAATAAGGGAYHGKQLLLSAIFLAGCGYRSFFPAVYGKRFALTSGWPSSIFLGRTVAMVAELAFALQLMLVLEQWAQKTGLAAVASAGLAIVGLLSVAQLFCWYGVATRRYIGELLEESLWTLGGAVMLAASARVALHHLSFGVLVAMTSSGVFLAFMLLHNLPMYVRRIRHDRAAAAECLGFVEGLKDMALRRHISYHWPDWSGEAAWLTPYFTLGVWTSVGMVLLSA